MVRNVPDDIRGNDYDPMGVLLFFQQLIRFSDVSSSSSASSDIEDVEGTVPQEEEHQRLADSLAEPEFSGLWEQNQEVH